MRKLLLTRRKAWSGATVTEQSEIPSKAEASIMETVFGRLIDRSVEDWKEKASIYLSVEFASNWMDWSRWQVLKHCSPSASTLPGILMDSTPDLENVSGLMALKSDFDSKEIDDGLSQLIKHREPIVWTVCGIVIDSSAEPSKASGPMLVNREFGSKKTSRSSLHDPNDH
jgi:hypothetical protein